MERVIWCRWRGVEEKGYSCPTEKIYIIADREISVTVCHNGITNCSNGEEIVHIRRGRKVGGGERRRNKGPSKTKIGS